MASAKVGELYVEIEARLEELQRGLLDAERRVERSVQKIEQAVEKSNPFRGLAEQAMRVLSVMGTIQLAVKTLDLAGAAFRGEWEQVGIILKEMPAGIGSVARAMEGLLDRGGAWLGLWESVADIQKRVADEERKNAERAERIRAGRAIVQIGAAAESELAIMQSQEPEIRRLGKQRLDALAQIEENARKAGRAASLEEIERAKENINALYDARISAIRKRADEEAIARREMEQQRIAALDAQIAASEARIGGDEFAARLIEAEARFDQLIAMAKNAEERQRLETLKTLEIDRMRHEEAMRMAEERQKKMEEEARERRKAEEEAARRAQLRVGRAVEVTGQRLSAAGFGLDNATKSQKVEDPQLSKTNMILERIDSRLQDRTMVFA